MKQRTAFVIAIFFTLLTACNQVAMPDNIEPVNEIGMVTIYKEPT